MKRKMLSLLLCCAMFLSLSLPAMATDTASEEKAQLAEQFSEAYMEKLLEYSACDELMSDAESEQILNRFSDEINCSTIWVALEMSELTGFFNLFAFMSILGFGGLVVSLIMRIIWNSNKKEEH